jgi:hypothetical protein
MYERGSRKEWKGKKKDEKKKVSRSNYAQDAVEMDSSR